MFKKITMFTFLMLLLFQSTTWAIETEGEILFRDSLYGAAIGALIGGAVYLVDQDDFLEKVGTGVVIGTVGGLIYGFTETRGFVEIEKDEIKLAVPTPNIQKKNNSIQYSASLLRAAF
jgi:hypothetical protein